MIKKTILVFIFLLLNTITYGQNKIPIIQNISGYIITGTDTIKIQRLNVAERYKLLDIGLHSEILVAVANIQQYLNHRSRGEKTDDLDSLEILFKKLTEYAKDYGVYFDLENYKKEDLYYEIQKKNNKRRIQERISDELIAQKKFDSLIDIKVKEKEINDSIEYSKQKEINKVKDKEIRKQEVKIQIANKKQEIEKHTKRKLENEKKKIQRREDLINKYGLENGVAILNHKVKIGWTKSMCLASWGKPLDINRTTNAYVTLEQCVYSLKKYLYFENGVLTSIQD